MESFVEVMIAPVDAAQFEEVLSLLRRNRLPVDGLREHMATTLAATQKGAVVGSGALELYGAAALLRSVAVEEEARHLGIGKRLVSAALGLARANGIERVYLLTEGASEYFQRMGFRRIDRAEVDPFVQQSVEFVSACPASATAMALEL